MTLSGRSQVHSTPVVRKRSTSTSRRMILSAAPPSPSACVTEEDALERHLRHEPTRASKSRIKRLRGLSQPQYRLRVGEARVFYDVTPEIVEVVAIVTKAEAARWLAAHGTPS